MTAPPGIAGTSLLSIIKARKQAQDVYSSDPKFKKFGQQIEKCLVTFDNVQEWADCIAFLKNLLKTLQTYTQFRDIPRKPIVSKRLSQCLNPALPTGVHQRALEVYSHIFSVIGPEGVERDLSLWTSGLFPFFEYAATSIKPTLIKMYTTHLLPLQEALRPSMRAFIICLLPGLEEETGEFFDQVLGLLDRLSGVVSPAFFFQNIWLILLTTPTARGTALNLLSRRLPRMKPDEDIVPIVGNDTGLFIRAFAAALEDENLLVQRAALDLQLQTLPLNSKTLKEASIEDREIIMRAAYSVVLRRDLSLNRRLYTWLLGPEESPQAQDTFFRQFGLPLLGSTLRVDMRVPPDSFAFSRPFKIFLSLLDKWEIGGPLTDLLIMEVLKILRDGIAEEALGDNKEIHNTASNLYDSVDPGLLWKHLLNSIIIDLSETSVSSEGIKLTDFVVREFHHDDDVQTNHFPIVLAAVLELLKDRIKNPKDTIPEASVQRAMDLVEVLVGNTPSLQRICRPALPNSTSSDTDLTPLKFSRRYYGVDEASDSERSSRTVHLPIATVLEDLISIATICIGIHTSEKLPVSSSISTRSLALILTILQRSTSRGQERVSLAIDTSQWLSELLVPITEQLQSFAILKYVINIAVELQRDDSILQPVVLDDRTQIGMMMRALFYYLQPEYAAYHHQAVALLWSLDGLSSASRVESMIAQHLCGPQPTAVLRAYEAFGTLWRLTDDEALPGMRLHTPMLIVLRSLSSDDISLQRAAESWLRVSLRSVLRVMDPLLAELLQHNAASSLVTLHIQGRNIRAFTSVGSVDQHRIHYLLKLILALIRHGGNSFIRVFRASFIRDSHLSKLAAKAPTSSYLEHILHVLIELLEMEPQPKAEASQGPMNIRIHSICVDILQAIISRGSIDERVLENVRDMIIMRLFLATHRMRLDIQDKLLHLLHSVLSALPVPSIPLAQSTTSFSDMTESQRHSTNFFTQVLIDGVTVASNRPVYQHWFDFIVMTLPKTQYNLKTSILPLIEAISQHINIMLSNTLSASGAIDQLVDNIKAASDFEWLMYLNALESLVTASLTGPSDSQISNEDASGVDATTSDAGGIFGFFGSDTTAQASEDLSAVKSSDPRALRQCVSVLFNITVSLADARTKSHSHSILLQRIRARAHRVYEQLWRSSSMEVLEWLAHLWSAEIEKSRNSTAQSIFDLVDSLDSGAQSVVHMLCERILAKLSATDRSRKQAPGADSLEWSLFLFLEEYLQRLEGPLISQAWPRFMQLAKEMAASARDAKLQAYATLRCMTILTEDASQASRFDDRRARKELQDTYTRLLDATISMVANREAGAWPRRKELISNGRDSPIPRSATATPLNEKSASMVDLGIVSDDKIMEIMHYIASHVLPNVRQFFVDSDKIIATCTNVIHNLVTPTLKGKLQPLDVNDNTLVLLKAATRVNGSLRSWRAPVYDAFNDARVFDSTPSAGQRWQGVVSALIDSDKTVLPELLTKIAVAPSANIFANREYEMLVQSLHLRRLSYILLASERNHYLTQLPSIVEKLVEIFKNVLSPVVQSEAYLCLRVLLCRLASHNLTSFWPTILTELYNTFEQLLSTMPPDGSESLRLILAASKFVDLLLVLQTEEFQVHQWIFISDTVDAIYRPDDWAPVALLDQLAEVAVDLPVSDARSVDGAPAVELPPTPTPLPAGRAVMRRPMLNKLRQIDSVRDLVPFFSHVSIASYESIYASPAAIDWVAVEEGILQDMFLGR